MSWTCPHENNTRCNRRDVPCDPGSSGCVLEGRTITDPTANSEIGATRRAAGEIRDKALARMRSIFGDDTRRIEHALNVLDFAETILEREASCERDVVVLAAILHDIGILRAEQKYGSSAGRYQEIEGPPIARVVMDEIGIANAIREHVCRVVANHHSAREIDTPEFRIVWDADWLVNLREYGATFTREKMKRTIDRVFKTNFGRELAKKRYLDAPEA